MKHNMVIIFVVLGLLLVGSGVIVYKALAPTPNTPRATQEEKTPVAEEIVAVDPSIIVSVAKSRVKDNAVVLSVGGINGKVRMVAYELTYESLGLVKGVNSGSKPIDVTGKDNFEREVYLGTCSRNVCKPDAGVKSVSVVLEFTNAFGKKSQFSKEYPL
ncbi:MAG: hypothetical protein Q8L37_00400 [Candidatus Gottesmanbacteria bacterium]|nr:hypothetical protein [Candidatus Gottesmanbacteria bacterium]